MSMTDQVQIICTVDVVLLTLQDGQLQVALLKRENDPYAGTLALPGGYVHADEDADAEDAAQRVLLAKTGIRSPYLEQLATFAGASRDPRGWSVSIAYYALVPPEVIQAVASPVKVQLVPVDRLKRLPFDHADIVRAAVQRVRSKSTYSSLPVYLCGEQFTIPKLQAVYEALLGEPINKVSFRRKLDEMDLLEPVEGAMESGRQNRPAQIYRLKSRKRGSLVLVERGLNSG